MRAWPPCSSAPTALSSSSMPSSERQRSARTWLAWLLRAMLFALPILLAWVALEAGLARSPNTYAAKRGLLAAQGQDAETLIVGASNAFVGLSPHEFSEPALNLAFVGEPLYYTDQVFTRALPRLPHLKRVVVSTGYISLRYAMRQDMHEYLYWREWKIPPPTAADWCDVRIASSAAIWVPVLGPLNACLDARRALHGAKGLATSEIFDDRGWGYGRLSQPGLGEEAVAELMAKHEKFMRASYVSENARALEHLVATARAANVEIVLVTMPVWSDYYRRMNPDIWHEAQAFYLRLARQPGVRYLDFSRPPQLNADDFYDPDHLSVRGAVRFTHLVDASIHNRKSNAPRFVAKL